MSAVTLSVTEYAFTIGTGADVTSTLAKGADAAFFDGSTNAFVNQALKTTMVAGSGYLLKSLTSRIVMKTGMKTAFRSAQSGRFISNLAGFSTVAARDATNIVINLGANYVWQR